MGLLVEWIRVKDDTGCDVFVVVVVTVLTYAKKKKNTNQIKIKKKKIKRCEILVRTGWLIFIADNGIKVNQK